MALKQFKENHFQRFLRTKVWPLYRDHPIRTVFGLWLGYMILSTINQVLFGGNIVLFYMGVGLWLFSMAGLVYSFRSNNRLVRYERAMTAAFTQSVPKEFSLGHDVVLGEVIARQDHRR